MSLSCLSFPSCWEVEHGCFRMDRPKKTLPLFRPKHTTRAWYNYIINGKTHNIKNKLMTRINIQQTEPNAYKAMLGLEQYLSTTGIPPVQMELIKIRASQINEIGRASCRERVEKSKSDSEMND